MNLVNKVIEYKVKNSTSIIKNQDILRLKNYYKKNFRSAEPTHLICTYIIYIRGTHLKIKLFIKKEKKIDVGFTRGKLPIFWALLKSLNMKVL